MKIIQSLCMLLLFIAGSMYLPMQAQKETPVTDTIRVSGNCGTCQKNIESALDVKGVKKASWNQETKWLTVTYMASKITNDDIQRKIAAAGYDTEKYKAKQEDYDKLHTCCKYDR